MKKSGLCFPAAAILAAMVYGACTAPLDTLGDQAEYDAQGRRLVTVTVDLENASRAVNVDIAKAYINFYEVVFERNGTEYYSATTTKGAGKRLSLRVPVAGTYKAYLNAGHLDGADTDNAVLLAQDVIDNGGSGQAITAGPWDFSLNALVLQINGPISTVSPGGSGSSNSSNPIYVTVDGIAGTLHVTPGGIPYYKLDAANKPVQITVATKVKNVVEDTIDIVSLGNSSPLGLDALITGGTAPSYEDTVGDPDEGVLTFGFTTPSPDIPDGLSNIGFDVSVALVNAAQRTNGLKPVLWHIRNGLDVEEYDNGVNDITNTGAGLVFAWGSTVPAAATETTGVDITVSFP
jgi:hypothetical protein